MKRQRATALILNEQGILLCVESPENKDYSYNSSRDFLYMPGGEIENNESPEMSLTREIKEELNLDVVKMTKLFDYETSFQVYKVYQVELSDIPQLTDNLKWLGYYKEGMLNKVGSQLNYPDLFIWQISNATMGIIKEFNNVC